MSFLAKALKALQESLFPAPSIEPERLAVRVAEAGDLDKVLFLNSAMAQEKQRRWDIPEGETTVTRGQIRRAIADRRSVVLVGTVDESVVGYAQGEPYDFDLRPGMWISAIYVSPPFRKSALASLLSAEIVARLPQTGAEGVYARVPLDDGETQDALAGAGMKESFKVLRRNVVRR